MILESEVGSSSGHSSAVGRWGLKRTAGGRNGEKAELIFPSGWALLPDFTEHREGRLLSEDLIAIKNQGSEPNLVSQTLKV